MKIGKATIGALGRQVEKAGGEAAVEVALGGAKDGAIAIAAVAGTGIALIKGKNGIKKLCSFLKEIFT